MTTIIANIIFTFGHIAVSYYRRIKRRCNEKKSNSRKKYIKQENKDETRIEDNSVII